ncbi:hypothetical protein ACQJBY_062399 [Aegilops geniculata]
MAGVWMDKATEDRMNLWLTRVLVLVSFAAHLTLALLAGIRRRRHSGVRRSLVWLAYYVTEIGTPIALTKVFIDTASVDSEHQLKALVAYREQQMFAFWAPFLLLHLGRPDNITSYALENKGLSPTQKAVLILAIVGAIYGSYKQRFMRGDGALRAAFFIMVFLGSYKYVERAVALRRASFDSIRRSNQRKMLKQFSSKGKAREQDNDNALLDAHGLLGVTMGAFADYQVDCRRYVPSYSGCKDVSKVVEMEVSLMYDMLYTKASVIHTWGGYIIRLVSPPATATALYLFHSKDGQAMESADRAITYTLLAGTLLLDVRWLLRALGSTWTYAFLLDTTEEDESKQGLLLGRLRRNLLANLLWPGRLKKAGHRRSVRQSWYWLRRLLVSLDPSRLPLRSGPSGHRLLPGSAVGQHNLLQECTTRGGLEKMISYFCAGQGKKKIDVKDVLLEVMCTYLVLELETMAWMRPTGEVDDYMRTNSKKLNFQKNIIALHVATDIFLLCRTKSQRRESRASAKDEKKIRALSHYMMFLLAQRQHMVLPPGDEASDYKKACLDLKKIWRERGGTGGSPTTVRETKLANILLKMNATEGSRYNNTEGSRYNTYGESSLLSERNETLALGAGWALKLLHQLDPAADYGRHQTRVQDIHKLEDFIPAFTDETQTVIERYRDRGQRWELLDYMLQLILVSWVRLLSFTSGQCSGDSHAKQLSRGGELLTIVWMMSRHKNIYIPSQ